MLILPQRVAVSVVGATVAVTEPAPVPEAPAVTAIHEAEGTAVQA